MDNFSVHVRGRMHHDQGRSDGPTNATMDFDPFGGNRAGHRAVGADGHLFAANVAMDIALNLEAVLGNDDDVFPTDYEVAADQGRSNRGGRP